MIVNSLMDKWGILRERNSIMSREFIDREIFTTIAKLIISERDKSKDTQVGERFVYNHRELELEVQRKDRKIIPVQLTVDLMGEIYKIEPNGVVKVVHLDNLFSEEDDSDSTLSNETNNENSVELPFQFFEREINDDVAMIKIIQSYLLWRSNL